MTSIEAQAKHHEDQSADRVPVAKAEAPVADTGLTTLALYVPKALRTKSPGFMRPIMIGGSILLDDKSCKAKMEVYAQGPATDFLHATTGGLTEIGGEFCDQLKAHLFYGKPLDYVNLGEELGDSWWYIAIALAATETSLDAVQAMIDETIVAAYEALNDESVAATDLLLQANALASHWAKLNDMAIQDFLTDPSAKVNLAGYPDMQRTFHRIIAETVALGMSLGHHLPLVWQSNIAKLYKRYPDKFDSTDALFRNLADERELLEANHDANTSVELGQQEQEAIARVNLAAFLEAQDGKFVGIDYIKKDGSDRSLNGRLGVKKFLKGGENTTEALDRSYLTVYDMKAKGYRNVDLASASHVRANGRKFVITG